MRDQGLVFHKHNGSPISWLKVAQPHVHVWAVFIANLLTLVTRDGP